MLRFFSFSLLFIFFILTIPRAVAISDLHFLIDSELTLQMRKIINKYAARSSLVITADFTNHINNNIDNTVDILVYSGDVREKAIETLSTYPDKLSLYINKNNPLYKELLNHDFDTVLKKISKSSHLLIFHKKDSLIWKAIEDVISNFTIDLKKSFIADNKNYVHDIGDAVTILPSSSLVYINHEGKKI